MSLHAMSARPISALAVLVAFFAVTNPASASALPKAGPAADANGCSVVMQNPHISTGAGGVIGKSNWSCTGRPSSVDLQSYAGFELWLCPQQPPLNYDTIFDTCAVKGENGLSMNFPGDTGTRYVPPDTQPGAKGSGWWISTANWRSSGPGGTTPNQVSYSNSVQINAVASDKELQ